MTFTRQKSDFYQVKKSDFYQVGPTLCSALLLAFGFVSLKSWRFPPYLRPGIPRRSCSSWKSKGQAEKRVKVKVKDMGGEKGVFPTEKYTEVCNERR